MADETQIAIGVAQIAAAQPTNICTFKRAYSDIPSYVKLSMGNLSPSGTRPGELMWQQLVRNIKSHYDVPGNFIYEGYLDHVPKTGYRLTPKGLKFLKSHGYV